MQLNFRCEREIAGQPFVFFLVNPVEPWLLLPQGNTCFLIKGQTIPTGTTAHFTDAGHSYIFRPAGFTVETSNH
ncbi:hypothetical protein IGI04_037042 [Brassica rapa subsp. trilocularis]|uniref:Uncharacterized protein n=1 Tax=Brassica rapa subsp. trilocularis TaxID=1813537 RepID=A0ABQ7LH49_BRACM|nr:hypothetical protein IGI04_037042 [Brassica rapa subsp. trilocularis]